jgi:hypothetical protein
VSAKELNIAEIFQHHRNLAVDPPRAENGFVGIPKDDE